MGIYLVTTILFCILSNISFSTGQLQNELVPVPVKNINGTNDTIQSGVWNTIDGGVYFERLSICTKHEFAELGLYYVPLCGVTGQKKRCDLQNSGSSEWCTASWMFIPTTEYSNWYLLRSDDQQYAAITWAFAGHKTTGEVSLVLVPDGMENHQYQKNGKFRSDVLFRIEQMPAKPGKYFIISKKFSYTNGIVKMSKTEIGTDKYAIKILSQGNRNTSKKDPFNSWTLELARTQQKIDTISDTNLYTGIWYTINLKGGGRLTFADAKVDDKSNYYYVQIVLGSLKDNQYREGKAHYKDTNWMIVATGGPSDSYFLVNQAHPNSLTTFGGNSTNGKYVAIYKNGANDPALRPDNSDDGLWRFEIEPGRKDVKYYSIYSAAFPENGIMTLSDQDTGNAEAKYCQIYTSGSVTNEILQDKNFLWQFRVA